MYVVQFASFVGFNRHYILGYSWDKKTKLASKYHRWKSYRTWIGGMWADVLEDVQLYQPQ